MNPYGLTRLPQQAPRRLNDNLMKARLQAAAGHLVQRHRGRGNGMHAALILVGAVSAIAGSKGVKAQQPLVRGGPIVRPNEPCVTDGEWAAANALADEGERQYGAAAALRSAGEKFTFYPMAGNLWQDLWTNNFVDLDPTAGILDWDCTNFAYNGHDASDTDLRSFAEQAIGVPVFAALDGTVVASVDGQPDMNVCPGSPCFPSLANYVILSHANGRRTYYWHLKRNSVAVSNGQSVKAGQQIGLTGSSGNSSWSHLHFAVYDNNGTTLVEPYAGACRPGASEWTDQTPIERSTYLRDFAVHYQDPNDYAGFPYELPRSGQIALSDPLVHYWFYLQNLPANSNWRVQFRRPNGTIASSSGPHNFGNAQPWRFSWWWHSWNIGDMHSITGTWHILLDVNNVRMVEAPIEVRTARTEDFNRPPQPIGVYLEPAEPTESDVIICRVQTDRILDDLDYDIVRYHYVWTVDGAVVRDVVTAAHSDVIPHHTWIEGTLLECSVTPSDGIADGSTASVTFGCGNNALEGTEQCDGSDDAACAGECQANCRCPFAAVPMQANPNPAEASLVRAISFVVPAENAGIEHAVRVQLVSLYDPPSPPTSGNPPDFSGLEGQYRYLNSFGGSIQCIDSASLATGYYCGQLGCQPEYRDWAAELTAPPGNYPPAPGLISVFGDAVVPSSAYQAAAIAETCGAAPAADFCASATAPVAVSTSAWGDVAGGGGGPSDGTANVIDIGLVVDNVKGLLSAIPERRAWMKNPPNASETPVNVIDIGLTVDAVKGFAYPYAIAACP